MDFCKECGTYLVKIITPANELIFQCNICYSTYEGTADDTLLEEEYMVASMTDIIHEQFVENSAFDDAANIIMRECSKCGLTFMTKIRVGTLQTTKYTCTCGNIESV
jgi:DNA-directed RNA polymerase subunit M/transcription elongation factor TFIIS